MAYYPTDSSDSMAEFDTKRVIDACNKYIKSRNDFIEKERQEYITKKMQPTKWLFGLITISGMTKEQAEKYWEDDGDLYSPKDFAEMRGYGQYLSVLSLRSLAHNTDKPTMFVSQSMSFIFLY